VSQAWPDQRERGSIIAIRVLVAVALLLGRRVARLILYPAYLYFLVSDPKPRAASRKYLGRVLGHPPRFVDLFRHFLAFATVGLDRVYLLKDRVELFESQISGEDVLLDVMRGGQGCFLLGAHLGSFEILRAFGTSKHLRIGLVMYTRRGARQPRARHRATGAPDAQRLEHYCRQAPYNWFNFYDFWNGSRAPK